MSTTRRNCRLNLVGTLVVSALSLCALALPLSSAKAQCLGVDLGIGCAGLGVGSWYSAHPYYYGYPPYYAAPYYAPAYYAPPRYYAPPPNYVDPGYSYTPAGRPDYGNEQ
jgi:hypothetical protein